MSQLPAPFDAEANGLYGEIRNVLAEARSSAARSVNVAMVHAYWRVGGLIERHVSAGDRAESYGQALMGRLSNQLESEFGRGFDPSNLRYMRLFYKAFDIRDAARHESSPADERRPVIGVNLSWTHYRLLTRVHQPAARRSTSTKPSSAAGAPAKLDRQITTRFYERGLAHRGTTASTALTPITEASPAESVLRDPYVLEFLDLRDRADTENAHLFNAPAGGALHVENLKGVSGEVALRVGDHEPFGVINVGDDDKLCSCARNAPSWW